MLTVIADIMTIAVCAVILLLVGAFGIGLYIRQKKQREMLSRAKFGGNK